jgi:hypothetical protein
VSVAVVCGLGASRCWCVGYELLRRIHEPRVSRWWRCAGSHLAVGAREFVDEHHEVDRCRMLGHSRRHTVRRHLRSEPSLREARKQQIGSDAAHVAAQVEHESADAAVAFGKELRREGLVPTLFHVGHMDVAHR